MGVDGVPLVLFRVCTRERALAQGSKIYVQGMYRRTKCMGAMIRGRLKGTSIGHLCEMLGRNVAFMTYYNTKCACSTFTRISVKGSHFGERG